MKFCNDCWVRLSWSLHCHKNELGQNAGSMLWCAQICAVRIYGFVFTRTCEGAQSSSDFAVQNHWKNRCKSVSNVSYLIYHNTNKNLTGPMCVGSSLYGRSVIRDRMVTLKPTLEQKFFFPNMTSTRILIGEQAQRRCKIRSRSANCLDQRITRLT